MKTGLERHFHIEDTLSNRHTCIRNGLASRATESPRAEARCGVASLALLLCASGACCEGAAGEARDACLASSLSLLFLAFLVSASTLLPSHFCLAPLNVSAMAAKPCAIAGGFRLARTWSTWWDCMCFAAASAWKADVWLAGTATGALASSTARGV